MVRVIVSAWPADNSLLLAVPKPVCRSAIFQSSMVQQNDDAMG